MGRQRKKHCFFDLTFEIVCLKFKKGPHVVEQTETLEHLSAHRSELMLSRCKDLSIALARFPRVALGHLPTPLEPMDRLSEELGGPRLWVKRDDCTGLSSGGNKTRKLEFLIAVAIENGQIRSSPKAPHNQIMRDKLRQRRQRLEWPVIFCLRIVPDQMKSTIT